MARVNVGVPPQYLSDQHLIAESVEITMITGSLRKNGFKVKSPIPEELNIGTGHINFFKNKLIYLQRRLEAVNLELTTRGIKNSTKIDLFEFPKEYVNDWRPSQRDSDVIRERIYDRLINPRRAKLGFHRYKKQPIIGMTAFADRMYNSPLFVV